MTKNALQNKLPSVVPRGVFCDGLMGESNNGRESSFGTERPWKNIF